MEIGCNSYLFPAMAENSHWNRSESAIVHSFGCPVFVNPSFTNHTDNYNEILL